jgi:hypothetical protein
MRRTSAVALASVIAFITGCASSPAPQQGSYRAPWAQYEQLDFRYVLAAYGMANISRDRAGTLDEYLRSQTKTYDQYIAAREVGTSTEGMESSAAAEIQSTASELAGRLFSVATTFDIEKYSNKLGGFPIFDPTWNKAAGFKVINKDVRTYKSTDRMTYGASVIPKGYGFTEAEIWVSKLGWVIPVSQEKAAQALAEASRDGSLRKSPSIVVYSLDRCGPVAHSNEKLTCSGTIRNIYMYSTPASIRPDTPPLMEMVKRQ